ncbi:hypothetical protein BU25DRAFT_224970 [Macroventuria anomochaeta]|uniref:Uncharacterized protein n=1 Tax=Macroventuria anomochaeta TaxID=301207 RepID=A0ACB6SAZ4_9PLEO|nr:uncharacterized protein BU25DRAFT_224970 [Macroventuria anomochaeta]KAF2631138.1 hypothetical protein BU25DRAFT_224970 [Macroventuria anomochaeta]
MERYWIFYKYIVGCTQTAWVITLCAVALDLPSPSIFLAQLSVVCTFVKTRKQTSHLCSLHFRVNLRELRHTRI